jgi:hypothetical protein
VIASDLVHETTNAVHLDAVAPQHAREDLDRRLQLLGNHLIGAEPAELFDLET